MIIKGSDIKKGTKLTEADGFLWEVAEIVGETEKSIKVRLISDFSSFNNHWSYNRNGKKGGIIKTFRKSTLFYGVQNG